MDEQKQLKKKLLFKLDDSKSMGPDKMHPKYFSTESFINAISKLFANCIEYNNI